MTPEVLFTGIAIALAMAPLGCFIIWRRMAYFGDALSHSALLGIGIGTIIGIAEPIAIILVALLFVICFSAFRRNTSTRFSVDTILGVLAHVSLALGIILFSIAGIEEVDLHDYLFGALDAITPFMMGVMVLVAGLVIGAFMYLWNGLLLMTHSREVAFAEGINIDFYEFALMTATGIVIAVGVQIIGILPITALLIIPAAAAQVIARSPEQMLFYTGAFSLLSMIAGLNLAITFEMEESGPPIVAVATLLFAASLIAKRVKG